MKRNATPKLKVTTYLVLLVILSCIFYALILQSGSMHTQGGIYVLGLMWCPGISGLVTQWYFEGSLKGLGWKPGKVKFLAIAYLLPLGYALVVYGLTWISGLGNFPNMDFIAQLRASYPFGNASTGMTIILYTLILGTVAFVPGMLSGLGEEIGWRGFLVPELCKMMSFTRATFLSGAIWTLWHLPILLFADYSLPGVPKLYAVMMFTVMVLGITFAFNWLRIASASLWPAVVLHTSHNLYIQNIFTPLTDMKPITPYLIDEFGIGLAVMGVLVGFFFWKKSTELPPTLPLT